MMFYTFVIILLNSDRPTAPITKGKEGEVEPWMAGEDTQCHGADLMPPTARPSKSMRWTCDYYYCFYKQPYISRMNEQIKQTSSL